MKIMEIIKKSVLFDRIDSEDLFKLLSCAESKTQTFEKNEIIIMSGGSINSVGLIISGSVMVTKEDANGNASIIAELSSLELFGEVLACAGISHSPVTVQAVEQSEVMFINYKKIINTCSKVCGFHTILIENMLKLIAQKNLMLNQKLEILSKHSIREKLITFFSLTGDSKNKIKIPFNREELSRYLSVDRSALSKELCKMRDEGLIKFNKNEFELLYL